MLPALSTFNGVKGGVGEKRFRLLLMLFKFAVKSEKSNLFKDADDSESIEDVLLTCTD